MFNRRIHKIKKLFAIFFVLLAISMLTVYVCDRKVQRSARGKLYSAVNLIPYNKTGSLLGTSKYLANGHVNPYYLYRLDILLYEKFTFI